MVCEDALLHPDGQERPAETQLGTAVNGSLLRGVLGARGAGSGLAAGAEVVAALGAGVVGAPGPLTIGGLDQVRQVVAAMDVASCTRTSTQRSTRGRWPLLPVASRIRAVPLRCSPMRSWSKSRKTMPTWGFSRRLPSEAMTPLPRYSGVAHGRWVEHLDEAGRAGAERAVALAVGVGGGDPDHLLAADEGDH